MLVGLRQGRLELDVTQLFLFAWCLVNKLAGGWVRAKVAIHHRVFVLLTKLSLLDVLDVQT